MIFYTDKPEVLSYDIDRVVYVVLRKGKFALHSLPYDTKVPLKKILTSHLSDPEMNGMVASGFVSFRRLEHAIQYRDELHKKLEEHGDFRNEFGIERSMSCIAQCFPRTLTSIRDG